MLYPDYFYGKSDRMIELYEILTSWILKESTRLLLNAGEMTGTADRLLYKLQIMGESQAEIEQKLRKMTGLTQKELRSLLQDAVLTSWEDDRETLGQLGIELSNPLENAAVIRVMDAEFKKSLGELTNLTRTTMKQSQIDLINMLDEADLRVAAGVQSYSAAVCDILDRYAGKGIEVSYPTGAKRTLESAVRMVVVTSMNQTAAQITNQYIVEGGVEYVLVSAHPNARTGQKGQPAFSSHMDWQGLPYKIIGSEPGFPNLEEKTGYRIDPKTGQGTVTHITALHGVNCRHGHRPWAKKLKNPWRDDEGNLIDGNGNRLDDETVKKNYQLSQKQRAMERSLRAWKRKLIEKQEQINNPREDMDVGKLQQEYDRMAYQLTQKNKAYNDFCKQNNLQPQYDRIKVADFGMEQLKRSNTGAKRYKDSLNISQNRNIIKERISNGEYSLSLSKQQYLKHVEGTKQYSDYANSRKEKGQSPQGLILISDTEVQEIIRNKYGTGKPRVRKDGKVANVEYVNADRIVGKCYVNGQWVNTKRVAIHYGKRGSHIVPVEDKDD